MTDGYCDLCFDFRPLADRVNAKTGETEQLCESCCRLMDLREAMTPEDLRREEESIARHLKEQKRMRDTS